MKQFLLLLLIVVGGMLANAANISVGDAKRVAVNWLNSTGEVDVSSSKIVSVVSKTENRKSLYHIVIFKPAGWVMVAGSDKIDPVLGYSTTSIYDKRYVPIQLQNWMKGIGSEVKAAEASRDYLQRAEIKQKWTDFRSVKVSKTALKSAQGVMAGPLLTCNWNQGEYFNEMAPADATSSAGNGHVWLGCVATAMAQIMKYWNYPQTGMGSHSFDHSKYGTLSANFGASYYDWISMADNPSSANSEIAEICYQAAVSVDMNFGPNGSGAYLSNASSSMVNYFKYNSTTLYTYKNNWDDAEWIALLKRDIDNGRPVIYSGYNPSNTEGHAWVCDGYNNDYFHFNFGWGGYANGNFLLSAINPISRNYTSDQGAIFSIEPVIPVNLSTPYSVGFESSNAGYFSMTGVYSFSSAEKHTGSSSLLLSKPSFSSYSDNDATLAFTVPTNANLSFWVKRFTGQTSANNQQKVVLMSEHGTTELLVVFSGDYNDANWQEFNVNLAAYAGQNVRLMFIQENFDLNREQWMYVDDISITGTDENVAPYTPSNPVPSNSATGVSITPTLQWAGGDPNGDGLIYNVHLGTTNNPPKIASAFNNSYTVSTLLPNTTYYWKIVSDDGTLQTSGPVWSFTTQGIAPSMGLCGVSGITSGSASVCGEIVNSNGATISSKGICWGTSPNPTLSNSFIASYEGTSQYNCTISPLEPFTTYYVRSYVVSNNGTAYSVQQSFQTLPALPVVLANGTSNIQRTFATVFGLVNDLNDQSITSRGVVWSTTQGFSPALGNVKSESGNWTSTGSFVVNLDNLPGPQTIYYRTFAQNSAGIGYSVEGQFETVNNSPVVDLDSDNSSLATSNNFNGIVTEQLTGGSISDIDVAVSDSDGDKIQSAQIILFNQQYDSDEFLFIGYSSSDFQVLGNNSDTLVLISNGNMSYSRWNEILNKVEFFAGNNAPDPGFARQVSVSISDGYNSSVAAIASINVEQVNDAPILTTLPALNVTPVYGQQVVVVPAVWTDELDNCTGLKTATYQWLFKTEQGDIDTLVGKTSTTLSITDDYCGGAIKVVETITDSQCGGPNVVKASGSSQWYEIQKTVQTITFDPIPTKTYSKIPFSLNGTSSSGLPLTFNSSSKDLATISGNMLTMNGVGKVVISCIQAGNSCYLPSEVTNRILSVEKGLQEINYQETMVVRFSEGTVPLNAFSTAGLELHVSSSDSSVAYVVNDQIVLVGVGNTILTATQSGNDYLDAALPVDIDLIVEKGIQTISASVDQLLTYGKPFVEMDVEVSSQLQPIIESSNTSIIKINGKTIEIVGVGSCIVSVTQPGNDLFNPAGPVQLPIQVEKGESEIDFHIEGEVHYGEGPYNYSLTTTSGLPVTVTSENNLLLEPIGQQLKVNGVGDVILTLTHEGDQLWKNSSKQVTVDILRGDQKVTAENLVEKHYGDEPFLLNIASSSNLPLVLDVVNDSVANVVDGMIQITGVGETKIQYNQTGNDLWNPISGNISLSVLKGKQQLTFGSFGNATYGDGKIEMTISSNTSNEIVFQSSDEHIATIEQNKLEVKNAGECTITATQAGNDLWEEARASQSFVVNKAAQSITSTIPASLLTSDKIIFAHFETSSGLQIDKITSSNESIVKVVGDSIQIVGVGNAEISASQNGNENYLSANLTVPVEVSYPVGIQNFERLECSLYPNPAYGEININVAGENNFPLTLKIFNALGEVVMERTLNKPITTLQTNKLRQGIYVVQVGNAGKHFSEKLIVK